MIEVVVGRREGLQRSCDHARDVQILDLHTECVEQLTGSVGFVPRYKRKLGIPDRSSRSEFGSIERRAESGVPWCPVEY